MQTDWSQFTLVDAQAPADTPFDWSKFTPIQDVPASGGLMGPMAADAAAMRSLATQDDPVANALIAGGSAALAKPLEALSYLGMAGAGAARGIDALRGDTAASDAVFRNVVEPTHDLAESSTKFGHELNPFAASVGSLLGTLGEYAVGPKAELGKAATDAIGNAAKKIAGSEWLQDIIGNGVSHAASNLPTAQALAGSDADAQAQQMVDAGVPLDQVLKAYAANQAVGTLAYDAPVAIPGGLLTRALSGEAIGLGLGAAQQEAAHLAAPDGTSAPKLPDFTAPETYIPGVLAAMFGGHADPLAQGRALADQIAKDAGMHEPVTPNKTALTQDELGLPVADQTAIDTTPNVAGFNAPDVAPNPPVTPTAKAEPSLAGRYVVPVDDVAAARAALKDAGLPQGFLRKNPDGTQSLAFSNSLRDKVAPILEAAPEVAPTVQAPEKPTPATNGMSDLDTVLAGLDPTEAAKLTKTIDVLREAGHGEAVDSFLAQEAAKKNAPAQPDNVVPLNPAPVDAEAPSNNKTATPTVEVPLANLSLSKDVPQFKGGANESTGVVEPLGGTFDRRGTGPIQVWRRNDGTMEVISGRHRLDLARRSGEETIPAQVYNESDGFTKEHAASLDAELNIRDGQGKVADYVQYLQQPAFQGEAGRAEADSRGLLARSTGRRAHTIASQGDAALIAAHRAGEIKDDAAVQIAQAAPNDARLQALGMKLVAEGKSNAVAANTMRAVKLMAGDKPAEQGDIFGFDDSAMREAENMARVASAKQRELSEQVAAVQGAAKRPDKAKALGVDVRDPEGVNKRIAELKAERAEWDNWSSNPRLVSDIRGELGLADLPVRESPPAEDAPFVDTATASMFSKRQGGADADMFGGSTPERAKTPPERVATQGGLFAEPTVAERLRAAVEAKDSARNAGTRTGTGEGGLFDGNRPEQTRVPDHPQTDAEWLDRAKADGVRSESDLSGYLQQRRHPETESAFEHIGGTLQDEVARNVARRIWNDAPRNAIPSDIALGRGELPDQVKFSKHTDDLEAPDTSGIEAGDEITGDEAAHLIAELRAKQQAHLDESSDALVEGFKALAQNPELFRNKPLKGKTPSELAAESKGTTYLGSTMENGVRVHEFSIEQANGEAAKVKLYDDGKKNVWIDVSKLESGAGAGERFYNLADSYAKNNGRQFVEDPAGVSDKAMYRRPVQQTAAMLKRGSAEHIGFTPGEPGFLETRRPGGPETRPIKYDAMRRLDPTLREHLLTLYHNTAKAVPEIEHYAYDADRGTFIDKRTGEPVGDDGLKRLASDRRSNPVREGMVRVGDSEAGVRLEAPPVGRNTIKAAILAQTLLRAEPHQRAAILGKLRARGGDRDVPLARSGLEGILPSKTDKTPADAGVSVSEAKAHAEKAWGKRLIRKLTNNGVLNFVTAKEAADMKLGGAHSVDKFKDVQGLYDPATSKAYVIADNVNAKNIGGVILHEVGTHFGAAKIVGKDTMTNILSHLEAQRGKDDAVDKAFASVPEETPANHVSEEGMGYLMEQSPAHRLVQRFVDAYKRGLNRLGIPLPKAESKIEAIRRIARENLRTASKLKKHGGEPIFFGNDGEVALSRNARDRGESARLVQTDTPAFKRWFGDSKVVGADGKPLVVYHGTNQTFDRFDNKKTGANDAGLWGRGHYFAASTESANSYALRQGDGARVIPAYVSITNPLVLTTGRDLITRLPDGTNTRDLIGPNLDGAKIKAIADAGGHDGVIQYKPDGSIGDVVAFRPEQIKSATGNSGAFDSSNPDIRYSRNDRNAKAMKNVRQSDDGEPSAERGTTTPVATDKNVAGTQGQRAASGESRRESFDRIQRVGQDADGNAVYEVGPNRARYIEHLPSEDGVGEETQYVPDMKDGWRYAVGSLEDALDYSQHGTKQEILSAQEKPLKRVIEAYGAELDDITGRGHYYQISSGDEAATVRVLKDHEQVAGGGFDQERGQFGERHGESDIDVYYSPDDHIVHVAVSPDLPKEFDKTVAAIRHRYEGKHITDLNESTAPDRSGVMLSKRTEEPEPAHELPPRAPGESQDEWHARVMRQGRVPMIDGVRQAKVMRDIGRGEMRAMWARHQRQMDRAGAAFKDAFKVFDKAGKAANLEAIHQWETGKEVTSLPHRLFFHAMKDAYDKRIQRIRELAPGSMQDLIENYFPHLWEDPTKAAKWYQALQARGPLEGNKSFLKQRVHDTIKDGMESGLKPISTNPVDLVLAKMAQMDKFIAFNEFRKGLQERGWLKEMDAGERVPYGYARVEDPAFRKAGGLQGYYAVPELIAKDINNYLAPSLYRFAGFKAFRGIQNFVMQARLGWSLFHLGFTTFENFVTHANTGVQYALHGDQFRAVKSIFDAAISPVWSPIEGHHLNQQWLGLKEADANTAAVLDALTEGGAHFKMSRTEYNNALPKFLRALRQRDVRQSLKSSLGAIGEAGSWFVHHVLVPNQKMAARVNLAKFELDRVAGQFRKAGRTDIEAGDYANIIAAMEPDALKQIIGKVVSRIDDRLGQMNYDNQFWNKTARESLQALVGAVGWQVGTLRTVTGAAADVRHLWAPEKLLSSLDKEGKITGINAGSQTDRLTYLATLALVMGATSAITQYAMTGQGPQELKDYFFPKTGRKNADGSDERLQYPSYWMDHYKLATHPIQTAEHKIHPSIGMIMEAVNNQDYFGTQIRNPDAPWAKQAEQVAEYIGKGFLPYTWTNMSKASQNDASIGRKAASIIGVTNAPASVSRTDFQAFVAKGGARGWAQITRTPEQAEYKQRIRDAEDAIRLGKKPDLSGLAEKDIKNVTKSAKSEVPVLQFSRLSIEDKLRAYDLATEAERKRYGLKEIISHSKPDKSVVFKRLPINEQEQVRKRIHQITGN